MGKYSINDIERLSGIKAHTIRIWEKRYKIFEPERTDTNIRYYTDDTLRKILKISILNNNGIKISHIADFSDLEIDKRVEQLSSKSVDAAFDTYIDALIVHMIELDEYSFSHKIDQLTQRHGFENVVIQVIYPLFERIGLLWQIGSINPAQEHFVSNIIRQKLIVAIDQLPFPSVSTKTFLLFLHENELHELGLLFSNYTIRKAGFKSIYIGQSVPYVDLLSLKSAVKFDYMFTSFISAMPEGELQQYINQLSKDFPDKQLLITGFQALESLLVLPENTIKMPNISSFVDFLKVQNSAI